MVRRNINKMLAVAALSGAALGSANAVELLNNGGFETGDLTGWTTSGLGVTGFCPIEPRDWNVSTSSSTGCTDVANPLSGNHAVYAMNDGVAGNVYELRQSFVVPAGIADANIMWADSIRSNYSGASRTFEVKLFDQSAVPLGTVFSLNIPTFDTDDSWTGRSFNIQSLLAPEAGNMVELRFINSIPETWTGPGGIGLDDISIDATVRNGVPDSGTTALLGLLAFGGLGFLRRFMK